MTTDLAWKRAWITGAGKGIGRSLARLLCCRGVEVYASARTEQDLLTLKEECLRLPGKVIPLPLDITDPKQIETVMSQWQQQGSMPELVVLNAGTHDPFSANEFSALRCQQLFQVNLQGTINCIEPVLERYIEDNHGHLAIMASSAGYRGLPTAAAYGASKAALINLSEALYLDLKNTAVKLQVICPGFVRTPLTDQNPFEMPAMMEADQAAQRIVKGLLSERFEIIFPRRFVYVLKWLRILPYRWYFNLISKTVKPPNKE